MPSEILEPSPNLSTLNNVPRGARRFEALHVLKADRIAESDADSCWSTSVDSSGDERTPVVQVKKELSNNNNNNDGEQQQPPKHATSVPSLATFFTGVDVEEEKQDDENYHHHERRLIHSSSSSYLLDEESYMFEEGFHASIVQPTRAEDETRKKMSTAEECAQMFAILPFDEERVRVQHCRNGHGLFEFTTSKQVSFF